MIIIIITTATTTQSKLSHKKKKFRKSKENFEGTKELATIKKHRMENNQDGNGKNKSSINIYTNKNKIQLNELIYAGAKLVCVKIRVPLKSTNKNQNLDGKFNWKCR